MTVAQNYECLLYMLEKSQRKEIYKREEETERPEQEEKNKRHTWEAR